MAHKELKVLLAPDHKAQQVMMVLKVLQVRMALKAFKVLLEPVLKELLEQMVHRA
jgi:hypothetical protein